ncbi:MAG TPA: bifunctional 4-hydroxy-3-methylbut-2-enyl diphosphate reductase/30S ribosomal protein S1 [Clostridiales bacterium]|nr:bifunctional 4-hydroxy-3-methylbut-2-enyl diphosphate reductase/30S ribosomal protein S1 [Clostridiales bacterium]
MDIIVSPKSGFCFGVKKAVDIVYDAIESGDKVYTLGPLIHNPQVISDLKKRGVIVEENLDNIHTGTVIIRSHGVGQDIYRRIDEKGLKLIDATCPFVKRIHNIVYKYWKAGFDIIIIGEIKHPEVIGINGWCNNEAHIVYSEEDIAELPYIDRACVVAQTTIMQTKWNELISILKNKIKDIKIFDTICNTTYVRQKEAKKLAKIADVMLVIGGRNSSNTQKLYNLCKMYCNNTFAIEKAEDINKNMLDTGNIIGITAGASTPNWLIEEVIRTMDNMNKKNNMDIEGKDENNLNNGNVESETNEKTINHIKAEEKGETEEKTEATKKIEDEDIEANTQNINQQDSDLTENTTDDFSMEDFENTLIDIKTGQIVNGKILSVSNDELIVNIGYKSDGIIKKEDVLIEEGKELSDVFEVGQEIRAVVTKLNDNEGNVILSHRQLEESEAWNRLKDAYNKKEELKGKCIEAVKGGVIASVEGLKAFVPASHISTRYIEDLETVVGQDMRLRIIEIDRHKNRLVASQKVILEEERRAKEEALWETIEEGQKIKGVVKNIVNFGAFVDIGGIDGLIHISDLAWTHVEKPEDVLSVGDEIEVVVLSVDRERKRVSLGYKQLFPHPWDDVDKKYPVGSIIKGTVSRITDFGAFIELEPGVDGLVHISEISEERVNKVEDYLSVGDEVEVKVLDVNPADRRISLSIKEAQAEKEFKNLKKEESRTSSSHDNNEPIISMGEFFPQQKKEDNE